MFILIELNLLFSLFSLIFPEIEILLIKFVEFSISFWFIFVHKNKKLFSFLKRTKKKYYNQKKNCKKLKIFIQKKMGCGNSRSAMQAKEYLKYLEVIVK